ncbi:hypothetical protein [Enterobacter asburiae]|uniref:hypothetical protein n=1 Tax=Enterobacter asburiae TaxID=61645 RepID=UPI00403DE272
MIPDEWAYAMMDYFGTYGIEELEDTLVDIASLFGLLPAILTGLLVRKAVKKNVIYEPSALASKSFLTRKRQTPNRWIPNFRGSLHFGGFTIT